MNNLHNLLLEIELMNNCLREYLNNPDLVDEKTTSYLLEKTNSLLNEFYKNYN